MSDRDRSSTAETTPISTPRGFATGFPRKSDKENFTSWHHKHGGFGAVGNPSSYADSTLLDSDFEDSTFPLFNDSLSDIDMANRTTPINISRPQGQGPSRNAQPSNLSAALRTASGNEARLNPSHCMNGDSSKGYGGSGVINQTFPSAAEPISVNASGREKPRRESLAGSMVTGMSWGGTSVGSWIRDEYVSLYASEKEHSH